MQGDILVDLERFEQAAASFDRVIALDPGAAAREMEQELHLSRPRPVCGRLAALRAPMGRRPGPGAARLSAAALGRRARRRGAAGLGRAGARRRDSACQHDPRSDAAHADR